MVMDLIRRIYSESMTTVCQTAVLEIQYFVARDFRLDTQLYKHCSEDAIQYCHASKNWNTEVGLIGPQPNPLILPCLYRYSHHPNGDRKVRHILGSSLISSLWILKGFRQTGGDSVEIVVYIGADCFILLHLAEPQMLGWGASCHDTESQQCPADSTGIALPKLFATIQLICYLLIGDWCEICSRFLT